MTKSLDSQILESIRTGSSQQVLSLLYSEVLPKVRSYILKNSGTEEDVRDIFQDAVISFYHQVKTGGFKDQYDVSGYIYAIARNGWMSKAKKAQRLPTTAIEDYDSPDGANQLQSLIQAEIVNGVREVMNILGDPCRTLLKYSVYESLSLKEIMEKMKYASTNVAKTYVYRCKKKLMDVIKQNPKYASLMKL